MKCVNIDGKNKIKYKSFIKAKKFADEKNEIAKNNNYLYTPLMAYKCDECNYFHVGRIRNIKKGKKFLNLKIIGFIDLDNSESKKRDIVINIKKDRFFHIRREIKNNNRWGMNTKFYLKKLPVHAKENCKIYICNSGTIKGYLRLIKIEDNKLVCKSDFRNKRYSTTKFIGFKYFDK